MNDESHDKAFDEQFGRIVVRREHYDAGEEIMKTAAPGNASFAVAEERRDKCQDRGDAAGVAFWGEVWNYLMMSCVCNPDPEIIILEQGDEWDPDSATVKKNPQNRNSPPLNDKDC
jgi:hypothetical protein